MAKRNRAEGWQHAKLTGHSNEELAKELVEHAPEVQKRILACYGAEGGTISRVEIGGLNESDVDSIFGGKTKSKPDMRVYLSDGGVIKISIKKSISGQVFLITADRFIKGFEAIFEPIPELVKEGIRLFWGDHPEVKSIIERYSSSSTKVYELKKSRLVHETLKNYNPEMDEALLQWFKDNIVQIFKFCFTCGLAKKSSDWADIIWYINQVDKDVDIDDMITIESISDLLKDNVHTIKYGNRNGGSTIQLPFGFVQWHDPGNKGIKNLQFHHDYNKIKKLID